MKTLEAFMEEMQDSEELMQEFANISDSDALAAFLKNNDCDATAEDFATYMQNEYARMITEQSEGEISDEAAEAVSGGLQFSHLLRFSFRRKRSISTCRRLPNFSTKSSGFFSDLVFRNDGGRKLAQPSVMLLSESPEIDQQNNSGPVLQQL